MTAGRSTGVTPGEVVIITVQYNNFADTKAFVSSLAEQDDVERCRLLIVDNSLEHNANELENLAAGLPFEAKVLRPDRNLYYWGGAEFALRKLRSGQETAPEWTMVCNNDIVFEDRRFVSQLTRLDSVENPIVAPSIISAGSGVQQNPMLQSPAPLLKKLKWRIYDVNFRIATTLLATHALVKNLTTSRSARVSTREHGVRKIVYAPHGACMIFSNSFFERGGSLDTTVPMFAEELTIAAQARRIGMPIWYRPELRLIHREHSTTGHKLTREKYEMERMARRHYFSLARQA